MASFLMTFLSSCVCCEGCECRNSAPRNAWCNRPMAASLWISNNVSVPNVYTCCYKKVSKSSMYSISLFNISLHICEYWHNQGSRCPPWVEAHNAYTCVVVSTASCTLQTFNVINFYDCISANIENNVHNKFLCMLGHNITIIH